MSTVTPTDKARALHWLPRVRAALQAARPGRTLDQHNEAMNALKKASTPR